MRNSGIKIDATRAKYDTSKKAITRAELVPVSNEEKAPFVWVDGILHRDDALKYDPGQKCGKIPGMDYMCYKSTLFSSLNLMRSFYPYQFNVFPHTYLLPQDFLEFQREHMTICGRTGTAPTWIMKPKNGCCGNGITIIQSTHEVQDMRQQCVIQQYVRPYLINGKKFDFRLYVLIASLDPLTIFIYREGIARFCSEDFHMPNKANKDDKFIHLTNTAINVENGNVDASVFTKKATDVFNTIEKDTHRMDEVWKKICNCTRAVIIGILPKLISILPRKKTLLFESSRFSSTLDSHHKPSAEEEIAGDETAAAEESENEEQQAPQAQITVIKPEDSTFSQSAQKRPAFQTSMKVGVVKHQTNMVLLPGVNSRSDFSPLVIGSIVNYKINPLNQYGPLIIQRRFDFGALRKQKMSQARPSYYYTKGGKVVCSQANPIKASPRIGTKTAKAKIRPLKLVGIEEKETNKDTSEGEAAKEEEKSKLAKEEEDFEEKKEFVQKQEKEEKEKEKEKLKPIPLLKRFYHVLGIDIMLDNNLEPQVLELNDRPSLSVTVDFEEELKVGLLSETFCHIGLNGEVYGDDPNSGWKKIFPLPPDDPEAKTWNEIYNKAKHPNSNGEISGVPATVRPPPTDKTIPTNDKKKKKSKKSKKHD